MVSKKIPVNKNVKSDPAAEEILAADTWTKDLCTLCQVECPSRETKIAHFKTPRHISKSVVFKFLTLDAQKFTTTGRQSKLAERYKDKGHEGVGLQTIYELVFPFAEAGWWMCSICYDVGHNYDQLDEHLDSAKHLQQFLDELYPMKARKMGKDWSQTERLEYLLDTKKQIHYEDTQKGRVQAPEEIVELSWTLQAARKRFMMDEAKPEYAVHPVAEDSSNVMILCQTCSEVIPCRKDCVEEAWLKHKTMERHRRMVGVSAILRQYLFDRVAEEERLLSELKEETAKWKRVDDKVYGPVCGIKHLSRMGDTSLCTLCGVMAHAVDEHFASESHLIRFMCTQKPRDAWSMMQASKEERREKLLAMIQSSPRDNDESRATKEACPSRLTWLAVECESEQLPHFPPPAQQFGMSADEQCVFCGSCWMILPIPAGESVDAVWNEHVVSGGHLDFAARRNTQEYDEEHFVPLESSVKLLPRDPHGKWITESVGEQVTWKYQTQTDIGLEYVVEDADQGLAVCTLCARSYPLGENCQMGLHVRSLQHLQQYLHARDHVMLKWVMDEKKEMEADELMLDFIVKSHSVSAYDFIRVHSKKKTKELESWPNIPIRTIQMSSATAEQRPIYGCIYSMIDQIANDKEEQRVMSARQALTIAGMTEIPVARSTLQKSDLAIFRCKACELCFIAHPSQLEEEVWEKHITSEDHLKRTRVFAENAFVPKHFTPLSSTYTVKPFVQKDPTKKVTWRWNALDKSHDLVLAIIGLEELVEIKSRESMIGNNDAENFTAQFLCRVCAVVVGRRAQMLEDHVRSSAHVFAYVNKHFPQTILDLERLENNDGGKERRKILANLLKDIKPPAEYCIPVYDPVGETERRVSEAAVKSRQREAIKKNEEMRVKAMEKRKKHDEERRKMKQNEKKMEQEREEDRKRREMAVMEKAAALNAERERMRKFAMEREAAAEIARKKHELERMKSEVTRDPAIAALLQQRDQLSVTLDKLRAAKAGGAVPEPKLIIPGPNQLASAPPTTMQQALPTMRIPGAPAPFMAAPPPNMALPPPGMPPPGMFGMPPPGMLQQQQQLQPQPLLNLPFSLPPPMMGPPPGGMAVPPPAMMATAPPPSAAPAPGMMMQGLGIGPKPVLSSFVPKVDALPVYPGQGGSIGGGGARRRDDFERPSLAAAAPDMYVTNPAIITSRQALVDYMWKQGNEEMPEAERPARFSRLCAATPACLGMEYIYEVVCLDSGDLTTMYCSMCAYWSTPMDTVKHMLTASHRLLYLFRNYKLYHKTVEAEQDQRTKEILLEQFAAQIRSRDNPPPCVTRRLKCYLNAATIQRLWPQYVTILDQSWRNNPICRTPSPPRRRARSRSYDSTDSRSRSYSRSRSRSPKERYGRRSRSRDRDHHRTRRSNGSRDRSRSRSPSRRGRDGRRRESSSRSRSGTPVNKTWQPDSMLPPAAAAANGSSMMMGGSMGMGGVSASAFGSINTSVPPPSMMPNMSVPPPNLMSAQPQPSVMVKTTHVITLEEEDSMQIATTPPGSAEKKKESERDRDRERRREKESKSSPSRKERSRSKDRSSSRRDSGRREKEREREREKKKEDEVDPVREEQRRKALEKVKEVERRQREQKEKEREKRIESTDERLRRDRRERSRERERKRSPSPSRKRKRSESRERRSSHRSSNGGGGEGGESQTVDWDSKAAAFLAKIGDLQGASKLIQGGGGSSHHAAASGSPYASQSPYGSASAYAGAAAGGRPGSGMGGSAAYEPLTDPLALLQGAAAKKRKEIRSPEFEPIEDEGAAASRAAAAAASAAAADEELKRKLLGVIVTMQREAEAGREMSLKEVDKLYAEIGLVRDQAKHGKMIEQLIDQIGGRPKDGSRLPTINLQDYGIPSASSVQSPRHGSPYYGGASSSRGGPPPPGYGRDERAGGDYYGGRDPRDPRGPPPPTARSGGLDAGDMALLANLRSLMENIGSQREQQGREPPPPSGPRSLPMPPGYGRRDEYDRREPYAPPSYPPYRSPAPLDEDPRMRRPVYDDPRADPYRDVRGRDPRDAPRYPPDPRYRDGYYEDAYRRGPSPPQHPGGFGSPYDRDMRGGAAPPALRGDPRDPRDARAPPQQQRPPMGGDPRLYQPPPRAAERPVLTREEYEARLRGEIPADRPTGSGAAKPAAAAAPAARAAPPAAAPPASKPAPVVTLDDDDWGNDGWLEEILGKAKAPAAAAAAAAGAAAPPAAAGKRQPLLSSPGGAAADAAGTAADAAKEASKQFHAERRAAVREKWSVRNVATAMPQPHLNPAAAASPPQLQQQPTPSGVPMGGQWDAAPSYGRPPQQQQYPPQHEQQQQLQPQRQQQQQGYYDQYAQNGGGYNASYEREGGRGGYY